MAEVDIDIVSDDDQDVLDYVQHIVRLRRPRIIRMRTNHFTQWDDHDFIIRFRLSKFSVERLIYEIEENIASPTNRNHALSPSIMVLMTLRFYATGSFLIAVGDSTGVHKSTACKVIHKVSHGIAQLRPRYVKFPQTEEQIQSLGQNFFNICRFPRCIGAPDCTHVKIISPGGENAETFRNRKQFFSINVQTISGPDLKILNIVARWPGASHDSTIFNNSNIRGKFECYEMGDNLIVGDSWYPIKKYLITPLANPVTPAEQLFNESQIRTRNPVERSYGVWKRRFPILAFGIRLQLRRVEAVIVATPVLHNMACEMREANPPIYEDIEAAVHFVNDMPIIINAANANRIRDENNSTRFKLINEYFQGLL